VARCYPMKNRFADILPFDESRVPLPCTKDEYINASFLPQLSPHAPHPIIAAQAPIPSRTTSDFWAMIWHHNIELIICLATDVDVSPFTL
jgi:tyrosine-protein phosphatase non-receptor type 23